MHEFTLACAAVAQCVEAAERADFSRVVRVRVALEALGHVDREALAFDVAVADTLADGARLEIERVAGAAHCLGCGAAVAIRSRADLCPMCGEGRLVVTGG